MDFSFREWYLNTFLEGVIQRNDEGHPIQLDLEFPLGDTKPPICRRTGIVLTGKGLICFDFDQTLTTAWFGHPQHPEDRGTHSTNTPNPKMLRKMEEQKAANNLVVIVTARGEQEGQLTGDPFHYKGLQPIITPDPTIHYSGIGNRPPVGRDWHPTIKNSPEWEAIPKSVRTPFHAFHLGAVSLSTKGESKGPFIASKMAQFNFESRQKGENPHPETGEPLGHYLWGILYDDGESNVKSANSQQNRGIALAGIKVPQKYEHGGEKPAGVIAQRSASGM